MTTQLFVMFDIFQKVRIDDQDLVAVVIGILWCGGQQFEYECAWLHNGNHYQAWISERRLTNA